MLSPVVKGCNQLVETQTFDMNEYRAQKKTDWNMKP